VSPLEWTMAFSIGVSAIVVLMILSIALDGLDEMQDGEDYGIRQTEAPTSEEASAATDSTRTDGQRSAAD
jgi:hypothetical protein